MPGSHAFISESTVRFGYAARMQSILGILRERALFVSFADDAFHFDISWWGIILVAVLVFLWRRIRR
jgi:hypothetical protein